MSEENISAILNELQKLGKEVSAVNVVLGRLDERLKHVEGEIKVVDHAGESQSNWISKTDERIDNLAKRLETMERMKIEEEKRWKELNVRGWFQIIGFALALILLFFKDKLF